MPPRKEGKKEAQKRDDGAGNEKKWTIEEAINSDSWKCVVAMAVERTHRDCFVLKEFTEEAMNGRRQEVSHIDFDSFVVKILNDFASGELPHKYSFLLNFSSVFREAVEYVNRKEELPMPVLVKVVKALLFYLREENLARTEKSAGGFRDPIRAMAERPSNLESAEAKKKDAPKRGDNGFRVRPPSATKQDTELLKRGERAKEHQCIDDAPQNACFNLYVLLTGFYDPDFPLELIKTNVPLHCVLCIDASQSGVKREASFARNKFQKHFPDSTEKEDIQNFWDVFLKRLWDPKTSFHFKNTVFQVYMPRRLLCEKKRLREFIYREMSYLMYDLSDLQRQLNNYLDHLRLWDVAEKGSETFAVPTWPENLPNECATAQIVVRCIVDAICGSDWQCRRSLSADSIDSEGTEWESMAKHVSSSKKALHGSCAVGPGWSQELLERGDFNLLNVYFRTTELDAKYGLDDGSLPSDSSERDLAETNGARAKSNFQQQAWPAKKGESSSSPDGVFQSYWKKHDADEGTTFSIDHCLYALLMTKVFCRYQTGVELPSKESSHESSKNWNFDAIENGTREMRKPHFTVTEGSRSILNAVPFNVKNASRDFFCPEELKVVTPEKLKASSAPEFRESPGTRIQKSYASEMFSGEISKNPFEDLRGLVDECLFSNAEDFDFLELLNRPKLLEKEHEYLDNYNCTDHTYFMISDRIFLMLHNRKDDRSVHHETFNKTLKTSVGLRDFYDYVLEDEARWLAAQEESYQVRTFLANKVVPSESFRDLTNSDFWLPDSIKYTEFDRRFTDSVMLNEVRTEVSNTDEIQRGPIAIRRGVSQPFVFEGYNVSDTAVQFSGLKTVYYAEDCSVTVELTEKLYGDQDLGVHVRQASHVLHLHSYVCPEPHVLEPFTFHVTYGNGIVVAFSRRSVETFEEFEERIESAGAVKSKKTPSEFSARVVKRRIPKTVKDDEFLYDMSASLPNGLSIRTLRRTVTPCYVKQWYLVDEEETAILERSRLFLPGGDVVKMMSDGTVQILKADASIVTANLSDLTGGKDGENPSFARCEVVSGGRACVFERGRMTASKRIQVFQNVDMESHRTFFRRRDGTNYLLQSDGTLCVEFGDGTKMSSSVSVQENPPASESDSGEDDPGADFVFVSTEIIAEHPDYATVVYDGGTRRWRILLPYDSAIAVEPDGRYFVDVDKQTELKVEGDVVRMNRFSCEREPQCTFAAHLAVFENKEGIYCRLEDPAGKIFIVEGNSNCYVLDNEEREGGGLREEFPARVRSEGSELVSPEDLRMCPSIWTHKNNKLLPENKYFVLSRDATGAEVIHRDRVGKALARKQKGSLVFAQDLPGAGGRCFVLVTPTKRKEIKKWGVPSVLPNPKYEPSANIKVSSSTHGVPPSWMHPFPKRKFKFVVPRPLTCRVFLETKKTDLSPDVGTLDCYFCEMSDAVEPKHSAISPDGVEEYLKRLSDDDQDLLAEIYGLAAASLMNEKKLKPTDSEKLERYLEMSRHCVAMREYHKKCIRYRIVPDYFHHPAGMSWLILNELLLRLRLPESKTEKRVLPEGAADSEASRPLSEATGAFSDEEIEYDLSVSAGQSFSSLSHRSDLSAQTAPPILRTGGVCRCKVEATKDFASSPALKCYWNDETTSGPTTAESRPGICEFQEIDVDVLQRKLPPNETLTSSLDDLMHLGLI